MDAREALEAIIGFFTRDHVYLKSHPCTVERDNGDGTVDVMPDAPELGGRGLKGVPLRFGLPATALLIEPGQRALLAFEDGSPKRPFIAAYDYQKGHATVQLDGQAPVARKGDLIDVQLSPTTPVTGLLGGDTVNPSPPPPTIPVPPAQFIGTATIASPVRAVVIGGAPRVKA